MTKTVYVLNGSNLQYAGEAGTPHLRDDHTRRDRSKLPAAIARTRPRLHLPQTNYEGQMVDWLQEAFEKKAAVVVNPAGFSFYLIPVLDALKMI